MQKLGVIWFVRFFLDGKNDLKWRVDENLLSEPKVIKLITLLKNQKIERKKLSIFDEQWDWTNKKKASNDKFWAVLHQMDDEPIETATANRKTTMESQIYIYICVHICMMKLGVNVTERDEARNKHIRPGMRYIWLVYSVCNI